MPDPKFSAVQYYNYPVTDENMTGSSVSGDTELYYSLMCGLAARNAYKRFFERLLTVRDNKVVLFHSVYGNDRTATTGHSK